MSDYCASPVNDSDADDDGDDNKKEMKAFTFEVSCSKKFHFLGLYSLGFASAGMTKSKVKRSVWKQSVNAIKTQMETNVKIEQCILAVRIEEN